jgi:hypothetical protein
VVPEDFFVKKSAGSAGIGKCLLPALCMIAALGFCGGLQASPPRERPSRVAPEEIVLHGFDAEGNELALRVPVNIFLARPGGLARPRGLAQLQQPGNTTNINLSQIAGITVSSTLYDGGNNALKVNCIVGCSGAASFTDNSAFTAGSTSVTNVSGLFNDTATNLTSGNAGAIRATTDRMLFVNIGKINGTVPTLTGSSLNVNCTGGCSSGAGFTDNTAFTAGTTTETNVGGVFNDGLTALSSGNAAAARITPNRGVHVNLRNNSGTEIATSANPLRIDPTGTTTQPVSGTVTTTPPANASTNVTQFGGTNVVTGTGASGGGIPRVTVSNDSQVKPWDGTNTVTVKPGSTSPALGDTAEVVNVSPNPSPVCTSFANVSQTAGTQVITGTASQFLYICAITLVSATAQSISIVEGTGTTCATAIQGIVGASSTTASMALAANGGFSAIAASPWLKTKTAADNLCLLQSGSGNVSGVISYVSRP